MGRSVFRLGELFCGPGGIAEGARQARVQGHDLAIEHAWANDYDPDACRTYVRNICPDRPESVVCGDVKTIDIKGLSKISRIDALAFGFPCNDYSIVGERRGMDGDFGPLYSYGIAALKLFKPRWFLAENVGGLRNANAGKAFSTILDSLFEAGYDIYPHLYRFEDYGIPQARHRIIIIGIHKDLDLCFKVPDPTLFKKRDNSCKKAIEVPRIPQNAPNNELTKQSKRVVERLKYIRPGENAFTADIPDHLQLNVKGARISQIYKRLDPNKPAYTITGSGGGGTHVYHWNENRALTNRERARLQTFPDHYVFEGSKESVRRQIGMAVPVQGARIIFEAILKTFAKVEYKGIECNMPPMMHNENPTHRKHDFYREFYLLEREPEYS